MNRSGLGVQALRQAGHEPPEDDEQHSGREYVERYLLPLSRCDALRGAIRERVDVLRIGRDRLLKRDLIGGGREDHRFRLLVRDGGCESIESADVVLDCSGTWRLANALGNGGIPAPGEAEARAADAIRYRLDDILGSDRSRYEAKRVLLVGSGHSAATALEQLLQLEGTHVVWGRRDTRDEPFAIHPDDPLPERDRLSRLANRIAGSRNNRIDVRAGTVVERLEASNAATRVTLAGPRGTEVVDVDVVLALVGYRPDRELYSELQFHECWATMGPMKLAATLLAGGSADCLAQTSAGAETLVLPEPDFFVLGAKSYGKNVNFLIRLGLEQIRDVFTLIDGDPRLNLYTETLTR